MQSKIEKKKIYHIVTNNMFQNAQFLQMVSFQFVLHFS